MDAARLAPGSRVSGSRPCCCSPCYGVLDLALTVLLWLVIFAVILSFLAPFGEHPLIPLLRDLTEPLLAPFRRLLPTVGPLDFSPILAILAIELARLLLARPLYDLALGG
ncbi:MAG: YggT family protein [Xanthomonadales bacterium]|nr:YggT family protein [Xanthomonadales bacterium]